MAKRKKPEGISIEKALEIDARLKAENEAATDVTNPAYGKSFVEMIKLAVNTPRVKKSKAKK